MVQFYKAPKKPKLDKKNHNNSMSNKEIIQMDTFDHAGNAVCFTSEPITIVENALPNETCEIAISKITKHARFATVSEVIKGNEKRSSPFCKFYTQCGGCSIQHTSAENGLAIKVEALHSYLLKHAAISEACWLGPITTFNADLPAKPGYRRRVRLAIDARRINAKQALQKTTHAKAVSIGYRAASSKAIVDISYCAIAVPEINRVLAALHSSFKLMPGISKVGHIVLTQGSNFTQLALYVTADLPSKALSFLHNFASQLSIQIAIINQSATEHIVGEHQERLVIINTVADSFDKEQKLSTSKVSKVLAMNVHSSHFLQVNSGVNSKMLSLARDWINTFVKSTKTSTILLDFFCGAGNFTLTLADLFTEVKGYEGISTMVAAAKENAILNNIDNCEFSTLDLSNKASLQTLRIPKGAIVVLDPSREGALVLCEYLRNVDVAMIIYVSCNANSFARDAKILSAHYSVAKITALDMFPYTKHIELMAMFEPK